MLLVLGCAEIQVLPLGQQLVGQKVLGSLVHVLGLQTDPVFLLDDDDGLADFVKHFSDAFFVELVQTLANEHGLLDALGDVVHDRQHARQQHLSNED